MHFFDFLFTSFRFIEFIEQILNGHQHFINHNQKHCYNNIKLPCSQFQNMNGIVFDEISIRKNYNNKAKRD